MKTRVHSLAPQNNKSQTFVAYAYNPSAGKLETHHWAHWPARLAFLESSRLERDSISKTRCVVTEKKMEAKVRYLGSKLEQWSGIWGIARDRPTFLVFLKMHRTDKMTQTASIHATIFPHRCWKQTWAACSAPGLLPHCNDQCPNLALSRSEF